MPIYVVHPGVNQATLILPLALGLYGLIDCRTQGVPDLRHTVREDEVAGDVVQHGVDANSVLHREIVPQ